MRFRTVLFDLDGTLVDHFAAIHRCHAQVRRHFGLPEPTPEDVRRAVEARTSGRAGGLTAGGMRSLRFDQRWSRAGLRDARRHACR